MNMRVLVKVIILLACAKNLDCQSILVSDQFICYK